MLYKNNTKEKEIKFTFTKVFERKRLRGFDVSCLNWASVDTCVNNKRRKSVNLYCKRVIFSIVHTLQLCEREEPFF